MLVVLAAIKPLLATPLAPVVPWRNCSRFPPKAASFGPRLFFLRSVGFTVGGVLLALVLLVVPCQARTNLLQVGIDATYDHFADGATVAVRLVSDDGDLLVEYEPRQVLSRDVPIWLRFFWRIDARQTNLMLIFCAIENCDGVAIGDADNRASEGASGRGCARYEKGQKNRKGDTNMRHLDRATLTDWEAQCIAACRGQVRLS